MKPMTPRMSADPYAAQHEQDRPGGYEANDSPQRSQQAGGEKQDRHGKLGRQREAAQHVRND
jgi:hypothetical protein